MNIGFIGAGYMAHEHAKVFEYLGCNIAAVSTRKSSASLERFSSTHNGARKYYDYFELLENTKLDAVIITTPPEVTETLLSILNERNIFSLVEKPGALNTEFLLRIIKNQKIFFGYNRRFYESVMALKIQADKADGYFLFNLMEPLLGNLTERKECLLNNSVHILDLIQFLIPNCHLDYMNGDSLRYVYNISDQTRKSRGILRISFGAFRNQSIHWDSNNMSITLEPIEEYRMANAFQVKEPTDLHPIRRYIPATKSTSDANFIASDYAFKPGLVNQARGFIAQCNTRDINSVSFLSKPGDAYQTLVNATKIQKKLF
jgi:hypothetical protein